MTNDTTPDAEVRAHQAIRDAGERRAVSEAATWVRATFPRDAVDEPVLALRTLAIDTLGEFLTAVETESMLLDNLLAANQRVLELIVAVERLSTMVQRLTTMQADPHGPMQ
jgi:hypothetical protein